KTSSAVRLTHIPSGIVVASQQERSQHKNRQTALKMLKNRLYQLEVERQAKKKAELDATKSDVTFGSQIRSYVFQPYTMVNDHRTELKIPDVQRDEVFGLTKHFDLGDVIGVEGPLFRTRTGEVTVRVGKVEMLAKSLRPLPFGKEEVVDGQIVRHSGLTDAEQRSRQRYVDL